MTRLAQKTHPRVPRHFMPPETAILAAQHGLTLLQRRKAAPAIVARGRRLAVGRPVGLRTLVRMAGWFSRRVLGREDGRSGRPLSSRFVAWQLLGGNAGRDWAQAVLARLKRVAPDVLREARRKKSSRRIDERQASSMRESPHTGDCLLVFPTCKTRRRLRERLIPLLSGSKCVYVVRLREGEAVDEVLAELLGPGTFDAIAAPEGPRWFGFDGSWSAWCARETEDDPCPIQPLWFDADSYLQGSVIYGTIVVRPEPGQGFNPNCLSRLAKKYFRTMPTTRK
jgi:hypothetical protein